MSDEAKEGDKSMNSKKYTDLVSNLQEFYTEAIAIINESGYFSYASSTAEKLLDYPLEHLRSMRLLDLVYPPDIKMVAALMDNAFSTKNSLKINKLRLLVGGENVTIFEGVIINKLSVPSINGFVLTFKLLNQEWQTNNLDACVADNVFEEELFSRCVFASLSDQIAVLSLDGTILAVNKAWEEFAGQFGSAAPKNASVGGNYLDVCRTAIANGEQQATEALRGILSVFSKAVPSYHQEYPCFTPTKKKWFTLNVLPFGGDDTKVVITHQDITERKSVEDALSVTTDKLKTTLCNLTSILESSLDLICTVNSKMEFETVNYASYKILGYYPDEMIGNKFTDYVCPEDIESTVNEFTKLYNGSTEYLSENCYLHKSGQHVPLLWSVNWDELLQLMYCVAKDMTERRKLQKSIETERDRYYDMFLKAPAAVVRLKGANHVYELANPLYLELVGKTDIIGKTVAEIIPEIEEQGFIKMLDSVYQTGKSITGKEVLVKLNSAGIGELVDRYLNFIFQAYRNLAGEIEGIFFFANDVTEQILARKMVEKSEKFFKGVLESSQDLLATVSASGKILYTSPAVAKVYGFNLLEISKMNILDFIDEDDKPSSLSFIAKVLGHPLVPMICPAIKQRIKDGSYIWVEATLTNFLDTDGINAIVCNFRDISARKISECLLRETLKELEEEKTRLITAQKVAKIGSWQTNTLTHEASWSDETFHILGVDPSTVKPSYDAFLSFIHPDDRDLVVTNFLNTLNRKGVKYFEHRIITADGITKWVEEKWTISSDIHGDAKIAIGTCQDITERKIAEQKILQSETKLKVAQHIAHVGSWEVDIKLDEHSWSDEFYRILEIDKNVQPSMESFYNNIYKDDREMVINKISNSSNNDAKALLSFRFIRRNGNMGYASTEWKIEFDSKGEPAQIYGIIRDLTDEHKAEQERQKMVVDIIRRNKDLEQFSYIISHNLRSPVANIIGLTEELKDESHSPEIVGELMEAISADVKRLEEVIVDLNMIVQTKRDIVERKEEVILSHLVDNILLSINFLIENKNIRIKTNFESVDTIWTIKSYMQSIFYNIISNSIKYRQNDKELMLEIETQVINKKLIIIFRDNGVGIDLDRYSPYIFGLYKRFHFGTEGKGLGLYMVKTQVETLGGTVFVKSEVNVGTEFSIEFEHYT